MKRILAVFIAAVMVFSMAACSGGNADVKPAASSQQNAEVKAEQTASSEPEVKAESAASEPEKKEPSEPETKAESEKEQPAPAENFGGYGGPGENAEPEFLGGYGGPGEGVEPEAVINDGPDCNIRFSDEETIYPNEIRHIATEEGTEGDFTVYTVPAGTKLFVEVYANDIMINLSRLNEQGEAYYTIESKGTLNGDDSWETTKRHTLKEGDTYSVTLNEAGIWRILSMGINNKFTPFFYEVKA